MGCATGLQIRPQDRRGEDAAGCCEKRKRRRPTTSSQASVRGDLRPNRVTVVSQA